MYVSKLPWVPKINLHFAILLFLYFFLLRVHGGKEEVLFPYLWVSSAPCHLGPSPCHAALGVPLASDPAEAQGCG